MSGDEESPVTLKLVPFVKGENPRSSPVTLIVSDQIYLVGSKDHEAIRSVDQLQIIGCAWSKIPLP